MVAAPAGDAARAVTRAASASAQRAKIRTVATGVAACAGSRPGRPRPARGRPVPVRRERRVGLGRDGGLGLDPRAVLERNLVARIHDPLLVRPAVAGAGHEDQARAVAGADERVLAVGRTVDEVPRLQVALLALDHQQALAGEHEEVLLVGLAVVAAGHLARLDHREREADVREPHVVALEDAGVAALGVRDPRGLRDVDDEPAVGDRREAGVELLETSLRNHADLLPNAERRPDGRRSYVVSPRLLDYGEVVDSVKVSVLL